LVFAGEVKLKAELKTAGGIVIAMDELQLKGGTSAIDRSRPGSRPQFRLPRLWMRQIRRSLQNPRPVHGSVPGATPLAGAADQVIPQGL
jgi:hypothetical protein